MLLQHLLVINKSYPKVTHMLLNSSSCTDLMFTNQPNLVVDHGVHTSLRLLPPNYTL